MIKEDYGVIMEGYGRLISWKIKENYGRLRKIKEDYARLKLIMEV